MKNLLFLFAAFLLIGGAILPCPAATADTAADPAKVSAARTKALAVKLRPHFAEVEIRLAPDEEGRISSPAGLICPLCSELHYRNAVPLVQDHRLLQLPAFAVAPDEVLAPDLQLAPETVAVLQVRFKDHTVPAKIIAIYPDYGAVRLKLAQPLPGLQPLQLAPEAAGPWYAASLIRENGILHFRVKPFKPEWETMFAESGKLERPVPPNSMIVNAQGEIAALFLNNNELPETGEWNTAFSQWPGLTPEALQAQKTKIIQEVEESLFPVRIELAPMVTSRLQRLNGQDGGPLEINTLAIRLQKDLLLVPEMLAPPRTALIRQITLMVNGKPMGAEFKASLQTFGGFLIRPRSPLPGEPPPLADANDLHHTLGNAIYTVTARAYPGKLKISVFPDTLISVSHAYRDLQWLLPLKDPQERMPTLFFTPDGKLLANRIYIREFSYQQNLRVLPATFQLLPYLDRLDPGNVPRLQHPESALGWLGVDFQGMTRELALAKGLAMETDNGNDGLLVTAVEPDSPAASLGIVPGDVLLGLQLPEQELPIRLNRKDFQREPVEQFPWAKLDQVPEQFFDELPTPWETPLDSLNRAISNVGVGKTVQLILLHQGRRKKIPYRIQSLPPYFDTAPVWRAEAAGITVMTPTFEVRRYFRMAKDAPGVLVSTIRAGSPASVAGLRPFELITAVNDHPVATLEEFQKALQGQTEVRLEVRRMGAGRVVTLKLPTGPRL